MSSTPPRAEIVLRTKLSQVFLILLACLAVRPAAADAASMNARLQEQIQPWADAGFYSGNVLVAQGDEVTYEASFGLANVEHGIANASDTRFAIASVTKGLQVILLAQLIDRGEIALDDPVSKWIEGFPHGDEITVEQLARHTAGIPHRVTEPEEEAVPRTAADMVQLVIERIERDGLLVEPGTESNYSSAGYSVLARVLELAGGAPWEEVMEREVYAPAGMVETVHPGEGTIIPRRASSYGWSPTGPTSRTPKHLSFLVGAGSLYSTPRDLLRAARAVVNGVYGETTRQQMLREDGGLSWSGRTYGFRTTLRYDPTNEMTIIICSNLDTGAPDKLRDLLPRIVAGEDVAPPEIPEIPEEKMAASALEDFRGSFQLRPGRDLGITPNEGRLDVDGWTLYPSGPDTFFSLQDFATVVFQRDEEGVVRGLLWGEYEMPRVDLAKEDPAAQPD